MLPRVRLAAGLGRRPRIHGRGHLKERRADRIKEMWADVGKHRFDLLLLWSLDRLTREGTYKTLMYLRRLTDAGVKFKSYTEQYIDLPGAFSDAIIGVLAAVNATETLPLILRSFQSLCECRNIRLLNTVKVVEALDVQTVARLTSQSSK